MSDTTSQTTPHTMPCTTPTTPRGPTVKTSMLSKPYACFRAFRPPLLRRRTAGAARAPRHSAIALSLAALLGTLAGPALALDYAWQGGSGNWTDSSKWTLLGVPGNGDAAYIPTGTVTQNGVVDLALLGMTGGTLGGSGTLTIGHLDFMSGWLGLDNPTGGSATVTGTTVFDGTSDQRVRSAFRLDLLGNASWTAGNGNIQITPASSSGSITTPGSVLHIGAGTTFTDAGAASASGSKELSYFGGQISNDGSYVRNGVGETYARNFQNAGLLDVRSGAFTLGGSSSSSGLVKVAAGSTLNLDITFGNTVQISGGGIANLGMVTVLGNNSNIIARVAAGTSLNGAVTLNGYLQMDGANTLSSVLATGGGLGGVGTTTVGTLDFSEGTFGFAAVPGGRTVVTGNSTFDGSKVQQLTYAHTLDLQGDATWTAGNGQIQISPASFFGSSSTPQAVLHIAAGATFTDAGAANAAGSKLLSRYGGPVSNDGSYIRNGVGVTESLNFHNQGLLVVRSGTFSADSAFVNQGVVDVAAGARLAGSGYTLGNDGILRGNGMLVMSSTGSMLFTNRGSLQPGEDMQLGTLTLDANTTFAAGSALDVDVAGAGSADLLAITGTVRFGGSLVVQSLAGYVPQVGDSYTIATYAQRLDTSTFDSLAWSGMDWVQLAVDYHAGDAVLRVVAVPEPASWLLLLAGMGLVMMKRRMPRQAA